MMPLFSFIIPIYNTDLYLNTCIDSLISQKSFNLEIILVDDGSTDKSPAICDHYKSEFPFIKVIHKKNEGLGNARNSGLDLATGHYISFIDSDDWLSPHMVGKLKEILQNNQAELLEFGLLQVEMSGKRKGLKLPRIREGRYYRHEIIGKILPNFLSDKGERIANSVCNHIYRRDIIEKNGLRFFSERDFIPKITFLIFNIFYLLMI